MRSQFHNDLAPFLNNHRVRRLVGGGGFETGPRGAHEAVDGAVRGRRCPPGDWKRSVTIMLHTRNLFYKGQMEF